ncbi:class I SAM-dependent methyltransferase [Diaphorobacter aerolatus]|uniref:Class I SAM-dependent methyltransferase n=1 Tax=Diaphorobacter aerolatus TaxID=1288495 RepID=A0A7H0GNK6_9BURK|nr:class I SAM-dependent methyltransferase [Diaphorobacter aerolatus]QNP49872.1 class I SAM-dependent methyltransferase [Diaphorobacter aerolatus]
MQPEQQKSEIRSGLRHVLAVSTFYDFFQRAVGAYDWRKRVIEQHVKPLCSGTTRILDIGCGTGEILEYLPRQALYFGFDRNSEYIESARKRFVNRNAEFICEDVNKNSIAGHAQFDIVLAIGILHHLDDGISSELFETARGALTSGGMLLTLDPVYTRDQSSFAKYVVSKDRGQAVRTDNEYLKLAEQYFSSPNILVDESPLRIPYTGIVMTCFKS